MNSEVVLPLGKYCTLFQAELFAILACVNSLQTDDGTSVAICSDSQAALKALNLVRTTSKLVVETMKELKHLSLFNSVRLLWVPGHFNVTGNEIADKPGKQAACQGFIAPEPRTGITMMTVCTEVQSWAENTHRKLWQSTDGCQQAKVFLHGPDKWLSRFALGLKRKQLRILVGLITGHITLNRYLTVMVIRNSIMGAYLVKPEELGKLRTSTLLRFVRATKRFL